MASHDPLAQLETFAAVLDALPIVTYFRRADGTLAYVSRAWTRFTGIDAAHALEHGYASAIHPDDAALAVERWDVARATGGGYRDEFRLRSGDGWRRVVDRAVPVREDGRIVGWFGTSTDLETGAGVAERARADLDASEEHHRLLGLAVPGVLWIADSGGALVSVGDAAATVTLPVSGELERDLESSIHPADRDAALAAWSAAVANGLPYEARFRARAAGTYRWHHLRALPQRDAAGAITRWVGVDVDIDDQRRTDDARDQLARVVAESSDFIAVGVFGRGFTYLNAAGLAMLEIPSLDVARRTPVLEYFTAESRAYVESEVVPAFERDGRWTGSLELRNFRTHAAVPVSYDVFSLGAGPSGEPLAAVITRDLRGAQRIRAGLDTLAEVGAALFASLDYERTLENVAVAVTRTFARYCIVDVLDDSGTRRCVSATSEPALASAVERLAQSRTMNGEHPVEHALATGRSTLYRTLPDGVARPAGMSPGITRDLERVDVGSMLCVPIAYARGGAVVGALSCYAGRSDSRGGFGDDDVRFAEALAQQAGVALEHARAYERERRIAVVLQEASLSRTLPLIDHLALSAEYRPGSDEATIGGDWYDAFTLDDGRVAVTLGDVLGHGLGAAVTMGKVRQAMRAAAALVPEPNAMLDVADRTVRGESDDAYATAHAGIFDHAASTYTFASAGHPGPVLRRPDGSVEEFVSPGLLLGMRPRSGVLDTTTIPVPPGTTLVFFTDGLLEATRDIEEGNRRIFAAIGDPAVTRAENPAKALVEHVLRGEAASDDVAVLIAEIGPSRRFGAASNAGFPDFVREPVPTVAVPRDGEPGMSARTVDVTHAEP